jgi:antitoxin component YwqK of YwqJK toxin-antitoxin module
MKKIFLTVPAFLFCLALNAQTAYNETWPNGQKKAEGTIIGEAPKANESKDQQAQRLSTTIRDGKWTTWYENGTVHSQEQYNKGKMTGVWSMFYDNGQKESEIDFNSGKAVYFHKNGSKHSEGGIAEGMIQTGKWTGYFENGNKNYEGSYNTAGQKTGVWTWYNEKGLAVTEQTFSNGSLTNTKNLIK